MNNYPWRSNQQNEEDSEYDNGVTPVYMTVNSSTIIPGHGVVEVQVVVPTGATILPAAYAQ
ncbi:hypothetical protein KBC03_06640 [Patescibacteria group bacterium]|nr:hypothetical protein [Patescibacteria group bacterium]